MTAHDPRVTAARADLAARHLEGIIQAPRYVDGRPMRVGVGRLPMRGRHDGAASMTSELLLGEVFVVYDVADGWAWGQAPQDSYVGYVSLGGLAEATGGVPTHRVCVRHTNLYPDADLKRPPAAIVPMGAQVALLETRGRWHRVDADLWIPAPHVEPLAMRHDDYVAAALDLLGVPYLWGGRSALGLDCSGLVQTVLAGAGLAVPRDSDQQAAAIGRVLGADEDLRRGDLVFFPGHVAIMVDALSAVHANAFAMAVSVEPLADLVARVAAELDARYGPGASAPISARRRPL